MTVSQCSENEDSRTDPVQSGTKRPAAASPDGSWYINSIQIDRKRPRKDASEHLGIPLPKVDRKRPKEDTDDGIDAVTKSLGEDRRAISCDNTLTTRTKHVQEGNIVRPTVYFAGAGREHPRDDAHENPAVDVPTTERINHSEVVILDDDKDDKEPTACGNRHQSNDATAIDLDGGQRDPSFPEQNYGITSPATDAVRSLSLCKVSVTFYCYNMCPGT